MQKMSQVRAKACGTSSHHDSRVHLMVLYFSAARHIFNSELYTMQSRRFGIVGGKTA